MLQTKSCFSFLLVAGCAGLIAGHLRRPGEVRKDGLHGWQLEQMMLPVHGEQIVRLDAKQTDKAGDAEVSLVLNVSDKPVDCNQVTFVGAASTTLTKVRFMEVGKAGSSAIGHIAMADLKSASASPGLKINWCDLSVALDASQLGKLKEFVEMAGDQ